MPHSKVAPVPPPTTDLKHVSAVPAVVSAAVTPSPQPSPPKVRRVTRRQRGLDLVSASTLIDAALLWSYHKRNDFPIYPFTFQELRKSGKLIPLKFDTISSYLDWMTPQLLQEAWYEIGENVAAWEPAPEDLATRFTSDHSVVNASLDSKYDDGTDEVEVDFEFKPETPNVKLAVITLEAPPLPVTTLPSDERSRFTKNDIVMLTTGGSDYDEDMGWSRIIELARVKSWSYGKRQLTLDMFASKKTELGLDGVGHRKVWIRNCFRISTTLLQLRLLRDLPHADRLLLDILCRATLPRPLAPPSPPSSLDPYIATLRNPGLNESQALAVESVLAPRHFTLSLIHGPPGTGKTVVVCQLVKRIVTSTRNPKILLCAPTQAAVDQALARIDRNRNGVRNIVRIGDSSKIRPSVRHLAIGHGRNRAQEQQALDKAVVIGATLVAASRISEDYDWDAIIVDDAGQATEPEILLALVGASASKCTKIVLVGDHMQLPHLVPDLVVQKTGFNRSLLERLVENGAGVSFLDTQFCIHPSLAAISSEHFYDDRLKTPLNLDRTAPWHVDNVLGIATWINVLSPHEDYYDADDRRRSRYREEEVTAVVALLKRIPTTLPGAPPEIGILTGYAAQRKAIQEALETEGIDREHVEVCTIDSFQGRRKDIIIVSMVRCGPNEEFPFMVDPQRINVAITRAKRSLWIVGDLKTYTGGMGGMWPLVIDSFKVFDYDLDLESFTPAWYMPSWSSSTWFLEHHYEETQSSGDDRSPPDCYPAATCYDDSRLQGSTVQDKGTSEWGSHTNEQPVGECECGCEYDWTASRPIKCLWGICGRVLRDNAEVLLHIEKDHLGPGSDVSASLSLAVSVPDSHGNARLLHTVNGKHDSHPEAAEDPYGGW